MSGKPPYAFRNHPLADHMDGCLALINDFMRINRNYLNATCARLVRAGLNVPEVRVIEDMLRMGAVLHDVGKAYRYYQEKLEKYGGGFEHHEILSAISCYKVLCNNYSLEDRRLAVLLLMSVLNHHQAFRESISEIFFDNTSTIRKVIEVARTGVCGSAYNLEPALSKLGLTVEEIFIKGDELMPALNEIRGLLSFFLKHKFDENRRWVKLYSLIMLPIILVDYLDSCEKREGSRNRLVISELRRVMGYE